MTARTVLIIEDEPSLLDLMGSELEDAGHTVLSAEDGLDGRERAIAHAEELDLVVLDLNIPKLPGLQVLTAIREVAPDLPVIITTGMGATEELVELEKSGAISGVIGKPFSLVEFLDKVEALFGA